MKRSDAEGAIKMPAKSSPQKARKSTDKGPAKRHYEGPLEWLFPMLEETYGRLGPKEVQVSPREVAAKRLSRPAGRAVALRADSIRHEERLDARKLAPVSMGYWEEQLSEFKRRKVAARGRAMGAAPPGMPAVPGQNNWTPLGPSIVA